MRWLILIAMLAGLGGCMSSLNGAQSSCSDIYSDYSPMWDCIKAKIKDGKAGQMDNDLGLRYVAFGDSVNENYKAGQISNADARLLLAQELSRGNNEFEARQPQRGGGGDDYCHLFGNNMVCF
jgi:hypothetical protein